MAPTKGPVSHETYTAVGHMTWEELALYVEALQRTNAELLQACNDALFVLQNKSYANSQAVRDTLENILSEAIRKAKGESNG